MKRSYQEKLRDSKWQERRLRLLDKAQWKCDLCDCERPSAGLQVHHPVYLTGLDPWEYPDELVTVLCEPCHIQRQAIERDFFARVAAAIKWKSNDELKQMPVWWMLEVKTGKGGDQ